MFCRLLVLSIFISGGLLASAEEINQLVSEGRIFDAAEAVLSEDSIDSADITNPTLQSLYSRSRSWASDRREAFLRRIGLTPTLNTILVALAQEQPIDENNEPLLLRDLGRQGAFYSPSSTGYSN